MRDPYHEPMTTGISDGDFNSVMRELTEVQDRLRDTPEEQFALRQDLRDREDALRTELRRLGAGWSDHLSIDQLERRIAVVEGRLEEHYGNRLSHTSGGQSGFGGGLDPKILHRMHRAMDKSSDLPAMKAELARLKGQLAKLMGD